MGLRYAFDLAEGALAEGGAQACARTFGLRLQAAGATYFQARRYRRPRCRLTADAHWRAGGMLFRIDEKRWLGRDSSNYVCFECNPLLEPVAKSVTRFHVSDYAPRGDRKFARYWEAWEEGGVGHALGVMAFGKDGAIANFHIGFADAAPDLQRDGAVADAASLVAERVLQFDEDVPGAPTVPLTARERDVLAFLSDGKTDWEISRILGISETTARFHADNARRKLGAVNRAQAVARYIVAYGFI